MNLNVYYDTEYAPITFDFATYLVTANCARAYGKFEKINLHVYANKFRKQTPRDIETPTDVLKSRLNHILKGVPALLPFIEDTHFYLSPVGELNYPMFPDGYAGNRTQRPPIPYLSNSLLQFQNKVDKDNFLPYRAPEGARKIISNTLKSVSNSKFFTITLRTSNTQIERNSNMDEWFKVYTELRKHGYDVFVIPDYEDLTSHKRYKNYQWQVFELAAFDHGIRLALYEGAVQNLCVLNGVMVPLFHSPYRYHVYKPLVQAVRQTRIEWFNSIFGIDIGQNFWWSYDNHQKINWIEDNFSLIMPTISDYLN